MYLVNMSLSSIKIKRNIYVKGYDKFPYQLLTGRHVMCYDGSIICGVETTPEGYDHKRDWYFDCDCEFQEWGRLVKIDNNKDKTKKK